MSQITPLRDGPPTIPINSYRSTHSTNSNLLRKAVTLPDFSEHPNTSEFITSFSMYLGNPSLEATLIGLNSKLPSILFSFPQASTTQKSKRMFVTATTSFLEECVRNNENGDGLLRKVGKSLKQMFQKEAKRTTLRWNDCKQVLNKIQTIYSPNSSKGETFFLYFRPVRMPSRKNKNPTALFQVVTVLLNLYPV